MKFISENGGVLAVLGVVALMMAGYAEWRISVAVSDKFEAEAQVEPHRMDQAEEDIKELEAEDDKLDVKIGKIIDILLEE
jgi:hypothetical protein